VCFNTSDDFRFLLSLFAHTLHTVFYFYVELLVSINNGHHQVLFHVIHRSLRVSFKYFVFIFIMALKL
jgi:hypothetical protein